MRHQMHLPIKPTTHSSSNPPPIPIRFRHSDRLPQLANNQGRVVDGGGRSRLRPMLNRWSRSICALPRDDSYQATISKPLVGHFRSVERREVDVGDDGSQGTADIGKGRLAEAGSPKQPFVETSR